MKPQNHVINQISAFTQIATHAINLPRKQLLEKQQN